MIFFNLFGMRQKFCGVLDVRELAVSPYPTTTRPTQKRLPHISPKK